MMHELRQIGHKKEETPVISEKGIEVLTAVERNPEASTSHI